MKPQQKQKNNSKSPTKKSSPYGEDLGEVFIGQHLTLKTKASEFIFKISFSSSHYNIADESVAITVCANVLSHKFKKWQSENTKLPSEYIGGGQIGNLQENHTWLKWNVANPLTRHTEIENIIDNINELAIPFFRHFADRNSLIQYVQERGGIVGISNISNLSKYLLSNS